jgi:hypothetical protein
VNLDSFDVTERTRINYDDYPFFNKKIDEEQDDQLSVKEIQLIPSKALFGADFESYKELLYEFENDKNENIVGLCNSESFINTRKMCANLYTIKEYLSDDEIKQMSQGFIQNSQVYSIVKHGHTQNFYEWIIKEKGSILGDEQLKEMNNLKQKALW